MESTPAELRHGIRGTLNALKLCVSAFDMPLDTSEKLEFLSDIESSADKLAELVERYAALTPDAPSAEMGQTGTVVLPVGGHVR
jgi:hypothetical protein